MKIYTAWKAGVIAFIRYPQVIESLGKNSQFGSVILHDVTVVQVFYRLCPRRGGAKYSALKQKVQPLMPGRQGPPGVAAFVLGVAREFIGLSVNLLVTFDLMLRLFATRGGKH